MTTLMTQKGVYPYEFLGSLEKLEYEGLPSIESFSSSLAQGEIGPSDHEHALHVYKTMGC